jgi:hypothetical protein
MDRIAWRTFQTIWEVPNGVCIHSICNNGCIELRFPNKIISVICSYRLRVSEKCQAFNPNWLRSQLLTG